MKIFVYVTVWWQERAEGKLRGKELCGDITQRTRKDGG
jgi:hypothetical protein